MLCKCSGKYIDIYFILKITFSKNLYSLHSERVNTGGVRSSNSALSSPTRIYSACLVVSPRFGTPCFEGLFDKKGRGTEKRGCHTLKK